MFVSFGLFPRLASGEGCLGNLHALGHRVAERVVWDLIDGQHSGVWFSSWFESAFGCTCVLKQPYCCPLPPFVKGVSNLVAQFQLYHIIPTSLFTRVVFYYAALCVFKCIYLRIIFACRRLFLTKGVSRDSQIFALFLCIFSYQFSKKFCVQD